MSTVVTALLLIVKFACCFSAAIAFIKTGVLLSEKPRDNDTVFYSFAIGVVLLIVGNLL